ncbi:ribonuclease P protein subunit [Candidatus Woesearchaeota archaeon]|nr:ribonuclease P protein subunit [Candidatus Woesearchaeota archaeon]
MDKESENILKIEFIGKKVVVNDAINNCNKNCKGTIIDETKEFIIIKNEQGVKKIKKKGATFVLELKNKKISIKGELINKRPEERIKIT